MSYIPLHCSYCEPREGVRAPCEPQWGSQLNPLGTSVKADL